MNSSELLKNMKDTKGSTSSSADILAMQKEWDEISCPICMDHPHNAVVLICASHEKGCRSYICDTSYRHSNCLDRFRKLQVKSSDNSSHSSTAFLENAGVERPTQTASDMPDPESFLEVPRERINFIETYASHNIEETSDRISQGFSERRIDNSQEPGLHLDSEERISFHESVMDRTLKENCLKCPLCRGNVLGWKIVKEARQYMDQKIRSCSRETCSFSGNYMELRRHARRVHPMTRPAEVDPSRQRAWRRFEHQQEYGDILSAIRSAMPGAVILGDYVIDDGDEPLSNGNSPLWTTLFLLHMISSPMRSFDEHRNSSRSWRTRRRSSTHRYLWGENLLGLQDDGWSSDDDDVQIARRRRRITRSRAEEDQQH